LNRQKASHKAGRDAGYTAQPALSHAPSGVAWHTAVEQTVTGLGYDLVDTERGVRGLLRVYIDCLPDSGQEFVTVEDCEKVTRQLQHVLEVEGCAYERLEVSSPGLDRPLKKPADFNRFIGQDIEVQLKEPFQGRKKFRGLLLSQDSPEGEACAPAHAGEATAWRLVFQEGKSSQVLGFSFHELREARLVPVVDFKGRRFAAPPAESNNEDKEDGDRDE
jgi:ribosome maturation factor RimP